MKPPLFLYLVWTLVILGLSLTPGGRMPDLSAPHLDKIGHAAFYAVLALLGCQALVRSGQIRRAAVISFTLAVLYGGLLEVGQAAFVPGRSAELADLLADATGALSGIACWIILQRKSRSPMG